MFCCDLWLRCTAFWLIVLALGECVWFLLSVVVYDILSIHSVRFNLVLLLAFS